MSAASRRSRRLRSRTADAHGHPDAGLASGQRAAAGEPPAPTRRADLPPRRRSGGPPVRAGVRLARGLARRSAAPISCSRSTRPPPAPWRTGRAPPGCACGRRATGCTARSAATPWCGSGTRRRPRPAASLAPWLAPGRVPWRVPGRGGRAAASRAAPGLRLRLRRVRAGRDAGPAHDGGQARSPGPVWSGRDATASLTLGYTPISWSRPTRFSTRSTGGRGDREPERRVGRRGPPRGPHQGRDPGRVEKRRRGHVHHEAARPGVKRGEQHVAQPVGVGEVDLAGRRDNGGPGRTMSRENVLRTRQPPPLHA